MATPSIDKDDGRFTGYLKSHPWCLCIGAGVSKGMVPDWQEVTLRLLNRTFLDQISSMEFEELRKKTSWSLDSWIQTSLNAFLHSGRNLDEFNELLAEVLYEDLLEKAKIDGLNELICRIFSEPLNMGRDGLDMTLDFFERVYPSSTNVLLAKLLVEANGKDSMPTSIITLNADTILHTLFSLYHLKSENLRTGSLDTPIQVFSRIFRANYVATDKIPFYHVHGCLLPPTDRRKDAREKLIFPESSFTEMSGSVFNWAQNVFLHYAMSHKMVFIGHSMSDPNIRRWLSWTIKGSKEDKRLTMGIDFDPLPHTWITTRPATAAQLAIMEQSMWHLGTRICWIDNWSDVDAALRNLCSMKN